MHADPITRVVVTGAAGFIGSALVRRLTHDGFAVLGVVRAAPAANAQVEGVEYVHRDLERVDSVADVLRGGDVVVHLAARVHRMHERDDAAQAAHRSANTEVARMLGRSLAERGGRRLIFLSTAKVFGEGRDEAYTQEDPLAPTEAYAESKAAAERVVRSQADAGGFEWTIVRPPFVYGRGGKGNFPRLVSLARLARLVPLPLASVDNRRSIIYVGNLVDAIVRCGLDPRASRRILLPTDEQEVSTPELIRAIAAAQGSHARLFRCPSSLLRAAARLIGRSAEMDRLTESLRLDSRYLQTDFGWRPPYSLERALAASVSARDTDLGADT